MTQDESADEDGDVSKDETQDGSTDEGRDESTDEGRDESTNEDRDESRDQSHVSPNDGPDSAGSTTKSTEKTDRPLVSLPEELRHELKEPIGPIETDATRVIEGAPGPIVAIGDVVTYHLRRAGRPPDVAVVDGKTKRSAVDKEIQREVTEDPTLDVVNPPAVLTEAMIRTLQTALEADEPTTILVEGEEDLVTLPAIVAASDGTTVVYGQPDEGMVVVEVDEAVRKEIRNLLAGFDGETDRLLELLE